MSEVLSTVMLTALTVVVFGAFGAVVLTTLQGAEGAPSGAFAIGDANETARYVNLTFVTGTSFLLPDVHVTLSVNDTNGAAASYNVWGGTHESRFSPGDVLRINVTAGAPAMGAGTRLHVLVVDRATGQLVGQATETVPDPGAPATNVLLFGRPSLDAAVASPATVSADGQRVTTVTVRASHAAGLGFIEGVRVNLSPVGGTSAVPLRDDGEGGDAVARDGVYTAEVAPPSRAASQGTETFTLTVSAADLFGRSTTAWFELTLQPGSSTNEPPTPDFSASPAGLVLDVDASGSTDPDGTIASYSWNWGDGTYTNGSASPTASHAYAAAGAYTVTLTVTDDTGAKGVRVETVEMGGNTPPSASVSASPGSGGAPLATTITLGASDPDGSIANWTLQYGDGTDESGLGAPPGSRSKTYSVRGTYSVNFSVTDDDGASRRVTTTVTVTTGPTASITPSPSSGSPPLAVTFTLDANDADGSIQNWTIDYGDGATDSGSGFPPATREHTYTTGGSARTVKFGVTDNDGLSTTATTTVLVNQRPTAGVSASPSSGATPLDVTLTLSAADSDGSIANWTLDYGDGATDSGVGAPPATRMHTYTTGGGAKTVKLGVTDNAGWSNTATTTVTVNARPTASVTPSPATGPAPLDVTFSLSGLDSDGSIQNWTLQHGDGTTVTGAGAPPASRSKTYNVAGTYQANFSVTDNQGASVRVTATVTASSTNLPPTARFTWSNTSLTLTVDGSTSSDPDGSIASYSWSWGDGSPASTGATASHTYSTTGVKTVTLTVTDNSGATHSVSRTLQVDGKTWFGCPASSTAHGSQASCTAMRNDTDLAATSTLTETATGNANAHRFEHVYTGAGLSAENAFTHRLEIRAAVGSNAEDLQVQVWDGSSYVTRITVSSASMQTYTYTFQTAAEWANGAPLVRLVDANSGGNDKGNGTQSTWTVDWMRVVSS